MDIAPVTDDSEELDFVWRLEKNRDDDEGEDGET